MGTAIKHSVPDRIKAVICNFWHAGTLALRPEHQITQISKRRLNPVWHRMRYSCIHMATVGVKRLPPQVDIDQKNLNRHLSIQRRLAETPCLPLTTGLVTESKQYNEYCTWHITAWPLQMSATHTQMIKQFDPSRLYTDMHYRVHDSRWADSIKESVTGWPGPPSPNEYLITEQRMLITGASWLTGEDWCASEQRQVKFVDVFYRLFHYPHLQSNDRYRALLHLTPAHL